MKTLEEINKDIEANKWVLNMFKDELRGSHSDEKRIQSNIKFIELKLVGLYEQRARFSERPEIKLRSEEEIIERYDTVYHKIKELEKEVQNYAEKNMLGDILVPSEEVQNKMLDYDKKQKELNNEFDFLSYMIECRKYIPWLLGLEG